MLRILGTRGQSDSETSPLLPERSEGKEGWTDERSDVWTGWSFLGDNRMLRILGTRGQSDSETSPLLAKQTGWSNQTKILLSLRAFWR